MKDDATTWMNTWMNGDGGRGVLMGAVTEGDVLYARGLSTENQSKAGRGTSAARVCVGVCVERHVVDTVDTWRGGTRLGG